MAQASLCVVHLCSGKFAKVQVHIAYYWASCHATVAAEVVASTAGPPVKWDTEQALHMSLLRDILGNPFHPLPPLSPSLLAWNAGAAVQLARAAYEERLLPEGHLDPA